MKTYIAAAIAVALAAGLAWELRDLCEYYPKIPLSSDCRRFPGMDECFHTYDHSRHIECGVNLPHIWLGGAK